MKPGIRSTAVLLIICCSTAIVFAQENLPLWLKLEEGKYAFEQGELGEALRIFRSVLAEDQIRPEPHYWIGRVFEEEGELGLAETEYRKAIDYSRQLWVLEEELEIRERLARLYKIRGDYARFELELLDILTFDEQFSSPEGIAEQAAMTRVLMNQGLGKVIELYRMDSSRTFLAHAELGLFYYRTGRYRDATLHLLIASMTLLTRSIEYQQVSRPFYKFDTLDGLLRLSVSDPQNAAYLAQNHASALFYYLGASLFAADARESAQDMMILVRDRFTATPWRARAIAQLADPFIEPVITSEEFFYFF